MTKINQTITSRKRADSSKLLKSFLKDAIRKYRQKAREAKKNSRKLFNKCKSNQVAQDEWDHAFQWEGMSNAFEYVSNDFDAILQKAMNGNQ